MLEDAHQGSAAPGLPRSPATGPLPPEPPAAGPQDGGPEPARQPARGLGLWVPVLFLLAGLFIGLQFNLSVAPEYADYTAVGILAALDAVIGAIKAELSHTYKNRIFITGFVSNVVLAAGLTFLGDRLGVDLFLAAVVAFGVRLFNNIAAIRRHFL